MYCFSKLRLFGMVLAMSGKYPAAERCLTEIMKVFNHDSAFSGGVTLLFWFLFNFPVKLGGKSIASAVLEESPDLKEEFSSFVSVGTQSCLGLYQVISSGKNTFVLSELITQNEITLQHSLDIPLGKIALIRVLKIMGAQ
jgi:hypothetical protein